MITLLFYLPESGNCRCRARGQRGVGEKRRQEMKVGSKVEDKR